MAALLQIYLFEAKYDNQVLEHQWLASLNISVFGNVR